MADNEKDIIFHMNGLNCLLKKNLELVSKWRVECARLQLEFLKLYTPEVLEIFQDLNQLVDTNTDSNDKPK
ncbi:uncharacterized protein LOC128887412 [Hylaeus anthracinus]|uniref:uncharacterized protein LOC128887412 n=1 Tax=Hylaeus anthracinus TaxID=313031 RepID=UPI0023B8C1DC|nr:uncharacterized protein LOC128887412 [Hylaeus anthracinus]